MDSWIPNQAILGGARGGKGLFQENGPNKDIRSMPIREGPARVKNLKAKQSGDLLGKAKAASPISAPGLGLSMSTQL